MPKHSDEIKNGIRFKFGKNWKAFLSNLNDERISEATTSLKQMLKTNDFTDKKFLDIGSGSGLFSLAARNLGATVYSLDYDPDSVACTRELRQRYFNNDPLWTIEEASALDKEYIKSLGEFDIVYSWGVLHHTGNMMLALENAQIPVKKNGLLYIAIYNDQGILSKVWVKIKKLYCKNLLGKISIISIFFPVFFIQSLLAGLIKYKNPFGQFVFYKKKRGMSIVHDWIDWLGGYPFEVAKPEEIFQFYKKYGFSLVNLTTTNRFGCNQFVFKKDN